MSYFRSLNQAVVESPGNSSTADLAAYLGGDATGADTFIGTPASTLGVNAIQVGLETSLNCSVWVEQSPDSTHWDISDQYSYLTESHNFGLTVQAIQSYVRTKVRNLGDSTTSGFRLSTVLCPIVEAVPRSLSEEGNLKVGVYEIEDEQENKVAITPSSALRTAKAIRLLGTNFYDTTIDTNFWTSTVANAGTTVQTGGQLQLRTNTTANGSAAIQTTQVARYVNGSPNYCRILAEYGSPTLNNTKRWGCFTGTTGAPTDGAAFEYYNGVPAVATYKGGAITRVLNGSLNGFYGTTIGSGEIPLGCQTFEIIYNNLHVWFMFNGKLFHRVDALTETWSNALNLPCRAENVNTGGGIIDSSLYIRSFTIYRNGEPETKPAWRYQAGATTGTNIKRGPGTLHRVVVNTWVNGSSILLYDALTATNPIAIITPTSSNDAQQSFVLEYGLDFYTGLTFTTVNATTNVTIVYE
jgi:hypothetical protein